MGEGGVEPRVPLLETPEVQIDLKVIGYSKLGTNDGENNVYKLGKIRGMKIRDYM